MKSNMWKSTFREIKQSFGRFLAIFAIIALGVSLFSGLKVLQPAMVKTTDTYFKEKAFYNYRIMSTLGFEQEDVEYLAAQNDVRTAEGAVTFDVLCNVGDRNGLVLKAHNLPERINGVELLAGRLPEHPEECVLDSAVFSSDYIGEKVCLAKENEEDDLEPFVYKEYKVVGIVQSPNYIQFERGNTSLGNGKISGFLYLPMTAFDVDYFTEILVKFDEDYEIYSDAYTEYMDDKEFLWEGLAQKAANARYDRIVAEAESELAEAKAEFEEEKAKAERELEDARIELADGKAELQRGEREIADAKLELENGRQELADGKEQLEQGRRDLWKAEKKLTDGEAELEAGAVTLAENRALLEKSLTELAEGKGKLEDGQKTLDEQKAMLNDQKAQLDAAKRQLEEQKSTALKNQAELEAKRAEIEKQKAEILGAYGVIPSEYEAMFEDALAQIEAGEQQVSEALKTLEAALADLADKEAQLLAGLEQLEAAQKQLDEQRARLEEAEAQLASGMKEIEAGEAKLEASRAEIEAGKKEIKKGWETLSENEAELLKGEQELIDGEAELQTGQQNLLEGWQEYHDGLAEYEDGLAEFETEIADAEAEIADAEAEIADIEEPESFVLGRETNVGYVCFENDSAIVNGIANVFPVFFYAVAALVCITTMNRMVEEQRTQIGVLKALGYSQASIMGKYLFYSGAAAITGCLFGYFFGTWFFPKVIWYAYGTMYDVDEIVYVFDLGILLFSLMVSAACSMGTTYLTCRRELSEVAAELMRPKAPKAGKRVLLERIPFVWNRMKFLHKVSYRNVFRYKKRFFMMVIGISGCTGLVLTGFGVQDSIGNIANDQYGRIQVYDVNVMLSEERNETIDEAVASVSKGRVSEYLYVMEKTLDLRTQDAVKNVNLVAIDREDKISSYVNLLDENGELLEYPKEGQCILTDKLAKTYQLKPGDLVTFVDENNHSMEVTLAGVTENYLENYVYMTTQTYENCLGEAPVVKSIYMNVEEGVDAHRLTADLMKIDEVASAMVTSDAKERFANMIDSLDLLVVVIILCAAFLAFIVLYNLTNINITERIREIATIKVLGFHKKETASYIFRENLILTFIGALVGLLLGKVFHAFVMSQVQVDQVNFGVRIMPISYLYSVLITFVFAFVVNWFMGAKLEKVSMTESLKSID